MKFRYILAAVALFTFVACDEYEVFDKEQYKNIFGFVCESDNTKTKIVSLHLEESTAYVSISMGGSNPPAQDVTITFEEDLSLIDDYNASNFDTNVSKYAIPLHPNKYTFDSYSCVVKAGTSLATIPVRIRPAGMSSDSTYFIPLRVKTYDNAEMDPEKGTILYKVGFKNHWAASTGTNYAMIGRRKTATTSEIQMPATKPVHPISENEIRVMPGNENFSAETHTLEAKAMIVTIGEPVDKVHPVTIRPYRDLQIEMVQPSDENYDDSYPNTYSILDDGFNVYKTFLLQYYYTIGNTTYQMKEELRIEYKEDKDVDEGFEVIEYEE